MGWHDATIHGVRLNQNLEIDLGYIFQWLNRRSKAITSLSGWRLARWSINNRWLEIHDIER